MAFTFFTVGSNQPQVVATVAAPVTQVANATLVVRSLTVGQSTPDMMFMVNWPNLDTGLILGLPWCSVAGTVSLPIYNPTGAPITPAAQTLKVIGF